MPSLPVLESDHASSAPDSGAPGELTEPQRAAIARELMGAIEGEVRFGRHDRMLYATDASLYQVEPIGVAVPRSVEDAHRVVSFCAARGLPILPRGGGTSLAGQCTNRAVVIDFSAHCRGISEIDLERRRVDIEPGVVLDELNRELEHRGSGLFFGPDVATSGHANIGGMIGNNSAGARSILYGRTVEHLLGLDVALAGEGGRAHQVRLEEGAAARDPFVGALTDAIVSIVVANERLIRERFPRIVRRVDGYNLDLILDQVKAARAEGVDPRDRVNLAKLVCGSEGTLATTLGATLNLEPAPVAKGLAVVGFDSLRAAIEAVNAIIATRPSAVELLDDMVLDLARANPEQRRNVELMPKPEGAEVRAVLYVEYYAIDDASELDQRFADLKGALPGAPMRIATSPPEMARLWKLRKAGEPLLHGIPGARKPIAFVEDTAVDPTRLPEFVERFKAIVEGHGTKAAFYAHASVGCLHIRPLLDIRDPADADRMRAISEQITDLVREFEGALSGEHGDGRVRSPLLERYFGSEMMNLFGEVKRLFDPHDLMNPGNIVGSDSIDRLAHQTRVRPGEAGGGPVHIGEIDTYYDYSDQHDFEGAVEMCNGAGVCRKKTGGTMCPSYMALLDERHATRGRGNALRLAISGQFGDGDGSPDWSDPDTIETLDLCLSCKACKSECPSNVDLARLKAEYTAQRHREQGGAPLTSRVFGRIRLLNRLGSLTPGLANWFNNLAPVRAVINRSLDIAPQRSLPPLGHSLYRWFRRRERARSGDVAKRRVALFADCFTAYNETAIGRSAVRVLEALGYKVELMKHGCCARPMISLGMLDDSLKVIGRTLEDLRPSVEDDGIEAILFAEPSCLSAITDDWRRLKTGLPRGLLDRLAEKSMLVEDFVERGWEEHPETPDAEAIARRAPQVMLHGHCHQKALWGVETSEALLKRLTGGRVETLDSGCCGMAGAFGFATHRYQLSMNIGELTLLPAARAAPQDTLIAAPGTSCRHQIHDGAERAALHPIQIADRLINDQKEESGL